MAKMTRRTLLGVQRMIAAYKEPAGLTKEQITQNANAREWIGEILGKKGVAVAGPTEPSPEPEEAGETNAEQDPYY